MTQAKMEVFKMIDRKNNLEQLLVGVMNDAINAGIPISSDIERKVYIDYDTPERAGFCDVCLTKYEIHMSCVLLNVDKKYIKDILAHEILHTCFLAKNHSWPWSEYAERMNKIYGYNIKEKYKSWTELGVM
jgi:hypothetical protein